MKKRAGEEAQVTEGEQISSFPSRKMQIQMQFVFALFRDAADSGSRSRFYLVPFIKIRTVIKCEIIPFGDWCNCSCTSIIIRYLHPARRASAWRMPMYASYHHVQSFTHARNYYYLVMYTPYSIHITYIVHATYIIWWISVRKHFVILNQLN